MIMGGEVVAVTPLVVKYSFPYLMQYPFFKIFNAGNLTSELSVVYFIPSKDFYGTSDDFEITFSLLYYKNPLRPDFVMSDL